MSVTATLAEPASALVRIGPHRGAHRVAARAGVSVLVPLLVLTLAGRTDLAAYASFGAFASLYGRTSSRERRAGMQIVVGAVLVACVAAGVVAAGLPEARWVSVVVGSLIAVAGAWMSDAGRWHTPGPLFFVFAFTVCASIPGGSLVTAVLVASASAAFAVLVAALAEPLTHPRQARNSLRLRPDWPPFEARAALTRPGATRHLARYLIAPLAAGSLALTLDWGHTYWALVAAVVPLAATDTAGRLVRAAHRVAGTTIGLGVAAVVLSLHPSGVVAVLLVAALQVVAEMLVGRNYGLALIAVTPLALLMGQLSHPLPVGTLLHDRLLETVLGVAAAVVVTLVLRERVPERS